jgi:hypothetical protein
MPDQFDQDHRSGSLVPTASGIPCLFVPRARLPNYYPTPYSYAAHLTGLAPFQPLDTAVLRRGKWLEPSGRLAIKDEFGLIVRRPNGDDNSHLRREAANMPARCWLDDVIEPETAVEYKSMSEHDFGEKWAAGPPDHVLGQVHSQMCIDPQLQRVLVIPIIVGYAATIRVEQFEIARDPSVCDMIRDTVHDFYWLLKSGELPEYDGTEPSYRAWAQHVKIDEDAVLDLSDDPEARWRMRAMYQAKLDRADVEAAFDAHKFWLAGRIDGAGRIRCEGLPEDLRVKRIDRKGYTVEPSTTTDWRFVKRGRDG